MDWTALGKAVTRRRVERGFQTLKSFSEAVGLSTRLLGDLESGRRASYDPATLVRIERALDWPAGRVDEILARHSPPPAPDRSGLHPLAARLSWFLEPDSPLTPYERGKLEQTVEALLDMTESLKARDGEQPPELEWPERRDHNPTETIPEVSAPRRRASARRP